MLPKVPNGGVGSAPDGDEDPRAGASSPNARPDDGSGLLPLFSDDGVIFQSPEATGTGGPADGSPPPAVGGGASAFVINVIYDTSVNGAPAAFKTAVAAEVQFLQSVITT